MLQYTKLADGSTIIILNNSPLTISRSSVYEYEKVLNLLESDVSEGTLLSNIKHIDLDKDNMYIYKYNDELVIIDDIIPASAELFQVYESKEALAKDYPELLI